LADNDNLKKDVSSEKKPTKSELSSSKLSSKSTPEKKEEKTKQSAKPEKNKSKPKKEASKTSSSGFLSGIFKKKVLPEVSSVIFKKPQPSAHAIETYNIQPPYSQVQIMSLPELGGGKAYFISEIELTPEEKLIHYKLSGMITKELEPPKPGTDAITHINTEAKRLAKKYGMLKKRKIK